MKNIKYQLLFDTIVIASFFLVMTWVLRLIHGWGTKEFAYSALSGIAGLSIGNVIGVYLSPFSKDEKEEFTKFQASVVSFIGGFLASKIDPIVNYLVQDARIISNPTIAPRSAVFLICLLFSVIYVFAYRKYYLGREGYGVLSAEKKASNNNEANDA